MSSAEDLAAVRFAIELCNNNYELKSEILCAPGSEYDRSKNSHKSRTVNVGRQKIWKETLERTATTILEELDLPSVLLEKVTSLVISIAVRMLTWAKHHEAVLGLSHQFVIKFLNSSFFTSHGIIDDKKAAEELMEDSSLSIKQKYVLACHYCFTDHIHDLFKQMSQEERRNPFHGKFRPEIVTFWLDFLSGEIDLYLGEQTVDQYLLEKAIESGCKAAVQYCLEETSLSRKEDAVRDAALETVRKTGNGSCHDSYLLLDSFGVTEYMGSRDYLADIFIFLFAKMSEEQKIEVLKKDIEQSQARYYYPRSRVLTYFLDWPYQNNFMKTAELMWDFLPESVYAQLLFNICQKINPGDHDRRNSEEKSYDYYKLLREFWSQSPDRYKRYVFRDEGTLYARNDDDILKHISMGIRLSIVKLFTLKNCTYEDRKVFELILGSATDEEKQNIISSESWKDVCFDLMFVEKWETLDEFLSKCISSKEEAAEFKRRICFTEEVRAIWAHFMKYKWEAAEFFLKWSSLSEDEIIRFKKETICSDHGKNACWYLYLHKGGEIANRCCAWCFSSEEEIRKFKKELIFSVGVEKCTDLLIEGEVDVFDDFFKWSRLSREGITEFKKRLQREKGTFICEKLISGGVRWPIYHNHIYMFDHTLRFQGGQWEQVEKFLTWCFSSEEEMRGFKTDRLLKMSGAEIHFQLIESNRWDEAETFFAWLGLSPEEVGELKKETLFNLEKADNMFQVLVFRRTEYEHFLGYGSKQEIVEMFLRWYLTDKEIVLEFRDRFKQKYENAEISEEDRTAVRDFESAIEQHLCDLDENQRPTKRN